MRARHNERKLTMKLTGIQIAAAITLSGLTRETLATEAGIGRNTLDRIINEITTCREDTIHKITHILESNGIEFLPGEGVRKRDRIVVVHEGEDVYQYVWDDIYATFHNNGGEVLIANVDESKTIDALSRQKLDEHLKRLKQANITERLLVREGETNLVAPLDYYHAIPEQYYAAHPFFIYGQKLALISRHPALKVVIIDDERYSESVRRLFNYVWDTTKQPLTAKK